MVEDNSNSESESTLRDLYPYLTEEELKEAEENLEKYLELVIKIYERIEQDPFAHARLKELLKEKKKSKGKQ